MFQLKLASLTQPPTQSPSTPTSMGDTIQGRPRPVLFCTNTNNSHHAYECIERGVIDATGDASSQWLGGFSWPTALIVGILFAMLLLSVRKFIYSAHNKRRRKGKER